MVILCNFMNVYTVAIVDDNFLARKSILERLKDFEEFKIQISAVNGQDAIAQCKETPVDIILMDIEMPVMDGITATQQLKSLTPTSKIIMLTTFDEDDKIFQAILNGASGYLLKDEGKEYIYKAMIDVLNGGAAMSPSIAMKTLEYVRRHNSNPISSVSECILSSREIEILVELKNGLLYKEISSKLFISEGTVRKHIENIYRKLQVNNRTHAVNEAIRNRYI